MKYILIVILTNFSSAQSGYSVAMQPFATLQECATVETAFKEFAKDTWSAKARTRCVEVGR